VTWLLHGQNPGPAALSWALVELRTCTKQGGATDMYQARQTEQERKLSVFFAKMEKILCLTTITKATILLGTAARLLHFFFGRGFHSRPSSAARPPNNHGPASRRPRPSAESAPLSQPLHCQTKVVEAKDRILIWLVRPGCA
jgi:hypothetical protein